MPKQAKLTERQIDNLANDLPGILKGTRPDRYGLRALMTGTIAMHLFTKISEAYLIKSEGGTDEIGNNWDDITDETKRRRLYNKKNKKAYVRPKQSGRGLLTMSQNELWKKTYAKHKRIATSKGMSDTASSEIAAKIAWTFLRAQGALIKKDLINSKEMPIMIDSGKLFRSWSPGRQTGKGAYRPANNDQFFKLDAGVLEFGSKVPHAEKAAQDRPVVGAGWEKWLDEALDIATTKLSERLEGAALMLSELVIAVAEKIKKDMNVDDHFVRIMPTGKPIATMGEWFISVYGSEWSFPGEQVGQLDEEYGVSLTLTVRAEAGPYSQLGERYLGAFKTWHDVARRAILAIHGNPDVIGNASAKLEGDYQFNRVLITTSAEAHPRVVHSDWFLHESDLAMIEHNMEFNKGLVGDITFGHSARTQPIRDEDYA